MSLLLLFAPVASTPPEPPTETTVGGASIPYIAPRVRFRDDDDVVVLLVP